MDKSIFQFVFFIAVLFFCLVCIGLFLLIVKISFLFNEDVVIMGIRMLPA